MASTNAVTALIVTYNGKSRGFLTDAVESVLVQTLRPTEILVIDDASTDGTAQMLAARYGGELTVVSLPENLGPSGARNYGLRLAKSPFVAFLDDDDAWLPTRVQRELGVLDGSDANLVFGRAEIIDSRGNTLPGRSSTYPESLSWPGILFRNPVHGPSCVLARRETVLAVGGFPEEFRMGEDWILWAKIARVASIRFLDGVVTRYRRHDHQSGVGRSTTWIREQTLAALQHLVRDLTPGQAALVINAYASGCALRAFASLRPRDALHFATAATGSVNWPSLVQRASMVALERTSPRISEVANRTHIRRLVKQFLELQ
jgi:glycosyltransferase involved in cell wall biosynthesis